MEGDLKVPGLTRASLAGKQVRSLSRGGTGNPDVTLVAHEGRQYVVKDFAARGPWMRVLGALLVRREVRAYRQLAGHPSVPRLVGTVDRLAFVLEYRPGAVLGPALRARVPPTFVDDLRAAVAEMHALGVVHLDLRHRSNALADDRGRPVLVDFASSLCFRRGGLAARFVLPLFAWIDRRALRKWERQIVGPPRTGR